MDPFCRENMSVIDYGTQRDIAEKSEWQGTDHWYSMTNSPCWYSQWRKQTKIPSRRATQSQGNTVVVLFRCRAWFLLMSASTASGRKPNTRRTRTLRHSRPSCRIHKNILIAPFRSSVLRKIHKSTQNMVPSPKLADRKRGFERIYLFTFFLGCCFLLLLWHSYGRSRDPGFENELHKKIKVHPLFPRSPLCKYAVGIQS